MTRIAKQTASSKPNSSSANATARIPGVDVARALAVLGMVLVNFKVMMGVSVLGPDWLVWVSSLIDGRAATLFVVLAGVGISLRFHPAMGSNEARRNERIALLKRAGVLFAAGWLNLHLWDLDILHFYGVYLAIAALCIGVRTGMLWILAMSYLWVAVVLLPYFDFATDASLWSLYGMAVELFVDGLYSVFPWESYLFVGIWLGRQNLRNHHVMRRVLLVAMGLGGICGLFESVYSYGDGWFGLTESQVEWLTRFLPPYPVVTMLTDMSVALVVFCFCILITQGRGGRTWVKALVATGQLALTHYMAHIIAILIPLQHDLLVGSSLALSIGYGLAFYAGAVMVSVWWRKRWLYGPLEGLIRQLTGRVTPGTW